MRSYLTILTSLILFTIVIFAIGCEPQAAIEAEKPITLLPEQIEPAPEPQAEQTVEPEVAEPKITEPIAAEPIQPEPQAEQTTEPAPTEPKITEPIAAEPIQPELQAEQTAEPEVAEPKITEPIAAEPIQPEPQAEQTAEPAPAEIVDTGIAVTVNGVDITESEIEEKIRPQLERLGQQAAQMPPNYLDQYKKQMRGRALEAMIVEMLLDEKVKANNIIVTDEDADAQLTQMAVQQGMTIEDLKALLEAKGQSLDETKQRMKKRLKFQKLIEAEFGDEANITEEDAQKYYSENKGQFETAERAKASHILLKTQPTDPNADPEQVKQQALAKAQDLLKQIKQGADFATLAKEHSEGPSAPKGGDLGFFGAGQMVKPFEEAAFALEVGQVSNIVETRFGYHIIKLTDRKEAIVTLFEAAKDGIITQLENQKKGELARQYIESLKAEANIVYPPGKEPAPKPMIPPRPGRGRRPEPAAPKP